MQLIRFVAVACMVAVSVASLGCGGDTAAPEKKEEQPATETSSTETTSTETEVAKTAEPATTGMTKVSLAISGMN